MANNHWRTGNDRDWGRGQAKTIEDIFTKKREEQQKALRKRAEEYRAKLNNKGA